MLDAPSQPAAIAVPLNVLHVMVIVWNNASALRTSEGKLAEHAAGDEPHELAVSPDGRLIAVWYSSDTTQDGSGNAIKARLLDADGTPLGPDGEGDQQEIKYLNGLFSGRELASNVMRNATLQVSAPVSSAVP